MFQFYSPNLLVPATCFSGYALAPCNTLLLIIYLLWLNLFEMMLDVPTEI